jgi:hypothetical protein
MRPTSCPRVRIASVPCTSRLASLRLRTITSTYTPTRKPKEEGSIASVFSSLSGSAPALPTRFSDLKKEIWREALIQSWREVLDELEGSIEKVVARGADVLKLAIPSAVARTDMLHQIIPSVRFLDLQKGLSMDQISEIQAAGVLIVRAGVPSEVWSGPSSKLATTYLPLSPPLF